MSLLDVSNRLLELSGRYDLTFSDRTWFLNAASRSLDSKADFIESEARYLQQLPAGNVLVQVQHLRSLDAVWLHSPDGGKIQCDLSKKDLSELRTLELSSDQQTEAQDMLGITPPYVTVSGKIYCIPVVGRAAQNLSDTTLLARTNLVNGVYVTAVLIPAPTTLAVSIEDALLSPMNPSLLITAGSITLTGTDKDDAVLVEVLNCSAGVKEFTTTGVFKTLTSVTAADFDYLTTGDEKITVRTGRLSQFQDLILPKDYTSIMLRFYPALTEGMVVEIFGLFWSDTLVLETDINFWTERYPELLVWETMLHLEVPVRNREGMRDFEEAINNKLALLTKEHVRFTTARVPRTIRG